MLNNLQNRPKTNQAWLVLGVFWVFLGLLSGCGFHLKGLNQVGTMSFQTVKLSAASGVRADLVNALTQQLKMSGVEVVDGLAQAELEIRLSPTQTQASRTSLTAQGDTASELIKLSQPFSAWQVADNTLVVEATASSFRDRRLDSAAALAANQELKSLQKQMVQEVALQMIDRISRASARANANAESKKVPATQ
ncbi:hypothetical protein [Thiosulfativibrio zosterae]|uniref:LPS-assembly lipoprotein LptE n=1 Tax=Thiosulfativibrio zosterae TaxID=2675053 RepID=A0A6F8PPP1_9GAMM|nr:hypothetical protein [Thiosulfativibrio zosterae]BBP44091.1 hypothetical protein THMIRHAT_18370 [Thiosulfativibrio zosterae]